MNRALLLLPIAALAGGCYVADPCNPPTLAVVWSPALQPSAGFTVPGLAAGQTCDQAGVTRIEVTISGQVVPCPDGYGYGCIQGDWPCGIGGVEIDISGGGSYPVLVRGFDASNRLKYAVDTSTSAGSCGPSSFAVRPAGVAGRLQFQYSFTDGGNLCAGASYLWFQVTTGGAVYDVVDDQSPDPLALACSNVTANRFVDVVDASGGTSIPPGVYTRTRFEEVSPQGGTFVPQRANCASEAFVHAGDEAWPVTLSASSSLCP